ncbi:MAG: diguanylate cyclase, partial [Proteobacteria bacterium]
RDWFATEIAQLGNAGLRVLPSKANFTLVLFEGAVTAESAYKALMAAGYATRWLPNQGLPHALRITIGAEVDMRGVVAVLRDLASMAEREIAALQLASIDELTQLSNRRGFQALAEHALSMCKRMGTPASLLFFDLDRFKAINDTFGHAEGDRALLTFAQVLRKVLREMDIIGRMGGDEFVALLLGSNAAASDAVITRLDEALAQANARLQGRYTIDYSVGRIEYDPAHHDTLKRLLADADGAMYARKRAARRA